jgi:hypothetical protein
MKSLLVAVSLSCLLAIYALVLSSCSTGPQLVPQTIPMSVTVSWTITNADGGAIEIHDCDTLIDRASAGAEATTTGNQIQGNTISPEVRTNVSATGAP